MNKAAQAIGLIQVEWRERLEREPVASVFDASRRGMGREMARLCSSSGSSLHGDGG
jgi:hypothetical protein|tara:strand:+ start:344 stop:511 length:168 start_codon:yes stop_codon:yes gene_type:complete